MTTVLQESLHCVALGIIQMKGKLTVEMLLDGKIFDEAFKKYCKVDVSDKTLYDFAVDNQKTWVPAIINNAIALKKSKYLKKNYTYYRSVGVMKNVYDTFKALSSKDGIKLQDDKWNPGDIWASTLNNIPSFESLGDYNYWISQQLKKGTLIGISLKKSKGNPKVFYINQSGDKKSIKFKQIKKPKSIFNTGITIETSDSKVSLNVRSFRTSKKAAVTSELQIKGTGARHGKKAISGFVKQNNIPQLTVQQIVKQQDPVDYINNLIVTLWKDAGHTFSDEQKQSDWLKRETKIDNLTGFYRSIINSLEFGVWMKQNGKLSDDILNKLFQEASSMSDNSSDFIKVY